MKEVDYIHTTHTHTFMYMTPDHIKVVVVVVVVEILPETAAFIYKQMHRAKAFMAYYYYYYYYGLWLMAVDGRIKRSKIQESGYVIQTSKIALKTAMKTKFIVATMKANTYFSFNRLVLTKRRAAASSQ